MILQEGPWPQGLVQILSVETPFCLLTAASILSVENLLSPSNPKITLAVFTGIKWSPHTLRHQWISWSKTFLKLTARECFDIGRWTVRCCCISSPGTSAWIKAGAYLLGEWTSTAVTQWELAACNISSLVNKSCWKTNVKRERGSQLCRYE